MDRSVRRRADRGGRELEPIAELAPAWIVDTVPDGAGELGEHRHELVHRLLRSVREQRPRAPAGLEVRRALAIVAAADRRQRVLELEPARARGGRLASSGAVLLAHSQEHRPVSNLVSWVVPISPLPAY